MENKIDNIILPKDYVLEYISDTISSVREKGSEISNAKYHHNTNYENAASTCKYGILTLKDLNIYGLRHDSEELLKIMADSSSHVNGDNAVSLAVVGLNDLYEDELEYDPFSPNMVDFLVTSDLKAGRSSINYGNEFLCYHSISPADLRSLDIRILQLIKKQGNNIDIAKIQDILQKYNYLVTTALELKRLNRELPLREMSEKSIFALDLDKLSKQPKLTLKK